jgi:hypothetical protein
MFSVIGHTLLAIALLFQFVTSRARDAREEQYLAVAFAQATPERRVRRRPPRMSKRSAANAAPSSTAPSTPTAVVTSNAVPSFDGRYAPAPPSATVWEGPSTGPEPTPPRPAARFTEDRRRPTAVIAMSPPPPESNRDVEAVRVPTDLSAGTPPFATPTRREKVIQREAEAPAYGPVSVTTTPGPGQKTMTAADIDRVPGTAGDVLKSLSVMPGISSPMDMSGELFVRGGSSEENRFYFDRILLGYPYHFGGLTSTISSDIIDRIDVHAGGFGAQFGEAQAVIDISPRQRNRDGFRGSADLNPLLSEWFLQAPVGEDGSAYVAGRRSYADLIIPKIIDIKQITAFPRFWDYQAGVETDLSDRQHLRVTTFASQDYMQLFFDAEDVSDDPEFAGKFHYQYGFYGRGGTLTSDIGARGRLLTTLSQYGFEVDMGFGEGFYLRLNQDLNSVRQDGAFPLSSAHTLEVGHELLTGDMTTSGFFALPPDEGDPDFDFAKEAEQRADGNQRFTWMQAYVQDRAELSERLTLSLGGRLGYFNLTDDIRVDPRVSLAYEWETGPTIRAAWGVYRQSPEPPEILSNWGNPDLSSTRATHYILELERQFSDELLVTVAGYYKQLDDLVTRDPIATYLNQGEGFARGMELFAKYTPSEEFLGWLSYTHGLSERRDTPTAELRPFSFDQTHVATAAVSYRPGRKWDIGLKWQFSTGLPFTPVLSANRVVAEDGSGVAYEPVFGPLNSERLPAFHRLDVRVARHFTIAGAPVETYLEVLNAYNRRNVFAVEYNDDYTEKELLYQLPLIPFIGVSTKF